jgi:hypothetical protein
LHPVTGNACERPSNKDAKPEGIAQMECCLGLITSFVVGVLKANVG